nr:MAG TPA: hypothetical protein [Caudoviricetes sp.]
MVIGILLKHIAIGTIEMRPLLCILQKGKILVTMKI